MTSRSAPKANAVVRPIRNSKEFKAAVTELDYLVDLDPKKGTPAYDRMELLGILIAAYENAHLAPMEPATPRELARFMAEQKGLNE